MGIIVKLVNKVTCINPGARYEPPTGAANAPVKYETSTFFETLTIYRFLECAS
jgi:hypothetical protein